jgi:plasmid stability protein
MASITLKDIPEDLHAQLKSEADANYRSLTQEAMVRIERSFLFEDKLSADQVNGLIEKAMKSGPEEPLTRQKFDAARTRARSAHAGKNKAA